MGKRICTFQIKRRNQVVISLVFDLSSLKIRAVFSGHLQQVDGRHLHFVLASFPPHIKIQYLLGRSSSTFAPSATYGRVAGRKQLEAKLSLMVV